MYDLLFVPEGLAPLPVDGVPVRVHRPRLVLGHEAQRFFDSMRPVGAHEFAYGLVADC